MQPTHNQARIAQRARHIVFGFALLGLTGQVSAQTLVNDAWARATVAGQQATGAFMTITASSDSKLIGAQSPVAKTVQIHQSTMKNDVMSMQPVEFIDLPAGKEVLLDSHSYHIMLIDLLDQVKEGDTVPFTLTIENAKGEKETIKAEADVRPLNTHDHSKMH